MFADGIFCEMAVFEEHELTKIPFAEGRVVWKSKGVQDQIAIPIKKTPERSQKDEHWLIGESLTCLYVGMERFRRGEKLSAQRFIQHFAVDRVLELTEQSSLTELVFRDPFVIERRFEKNFPIFSQLLPSFIQGYDKSPESPLSILSFLDQNYSINQVIKKEIINLCF